MQASEPTLIYDASCGFCRKWVGRLKRWDRREVIRLLPLDDPAATTLAGRSVEELQQAAHIVTPEGRVFAGAAAMREALRYVPFGWAPRAALSLPGALPVAERMYRWIARRWGPVRQ